MSHNIDEIKLKAEAGDAEAQDKLGDMYRLGNGIGQNYEEALKWYKASEAQGNISARNHIGVMYHFGYGVPSQDRQIRTALARICLFSIQENQTSEL